MNDYQRYAVWILMALFFGFLTLINANLSNIAETLESGRIECRAPR